MIIQRKYFDEELNDFVFTKSFSISELPQENEITIGKMGFGKTPPIVPYLHDDSKLLVLDKIPTERDFLSFCNSQFPVVIKDVSYMNKKGNVFLINKNKANWLSNPFYDSMSLIAVYDVFCNTWYQKRYENKNFQVKLLRNIFIPNVSEEYRIYFYTNKENQKEILRISSSPINKSNSVPLNILLSKSEELLKHDNQIAKLPSGTIDYVFNGEELVVIETHLMAAVGIASYDPMYDNMNGDKLLDAFEQSFRVFDNFIDKPTINKTKVKP